ncbi:MAG TPA: BBP7 family outer membrane beta-barrel protein, partial [Gemmataceae bacterium]|nr:BBP7 family outer membrane beta-barrel protein [Gemmataceae bacterium]
VSVPGASTGSVGISADLRFWGAEANAYRNLVYTSCWEVTALAGFRYLDLMENLGVSSTSADLLLGGTTTTVPDRFTTRNQLYLGQVGAQATWTSGPVFVNFQGKVGLGPNGERVRILGSSIQTVPGFPTRFSQGGLLAVPATPALPGGGNFGVHSSNFFVIVPEVGLDVGWQISERVRLSAGYSLLYINSVARPGSQVNPTINRALVPSDPVFGSASGPNQPAVSSKQETFFAHGALLNLELCY